MMIVGAALEHLRTGDACIIDNKWCGIRRIAARDCEEGARPCGIAMEDITAPCVVTVNKGQVLRIVSDIHFKTQSDVVHYIVTHAAVLRLLAALAVP